jgi:hypothetical protein
VHDERTGGQAIDLVGEAFPEFAVRVCSSGYDGLGRQFAVDAELKPGARDPAA